MSEVVTTSWLVSLVLSGVTRRSLFTVAKQTREWTTTTVSPGTSATANLKRWYHSANELASGGWTERYGPDHARDPRHPGRREPSGIYLIDGDHRRVRPLHAFTAIAAWSIKGRCESDGVSWV